MSFGFAMTKTKSSRCSVAKRFGRALGSRYFCGSLCTSMGPVSSFSWAATTRVETPTKRNKSEKSRGPESP
jgi:hypothetical protein